MTQPESSAVEPITWSVHPLRERPLAGVLAVLAVVALAGAVQLFAESRVWGVVAALVLCLALRRFFFASRFEIAASGVRAQWFLGGRFLELAEIRRVVIGTDAAWVSPYRTPQPRDRSRGVPLAFGNCGPAVADALRRLATRSGARLIERGGGGAAGASAEG